MKLKRRKGSLLVVVAFGVMMAFVCVLMLSMSNTLTTVTKESAKIYENIQNYRAASELACWKYVNDLQSVVVSKDLDADWVNPMDPGNLDWSSVTNRAVYSQALEVIQETQKDPDYTGSGIRWNKDTISEALEGIPLSDASVLPTLFGKFTGYTQLFDLIVPSDMLIKNDSTWSYTRHHEAAFELEPFEVDVNLKIRGETLNERFLVSKLFLYVKIEDSLGAGGVNHHVASMYVSDIEDEGIEIQRVRYSEEVGEDFSVVAGEGFDEA